MHKATYPSFYKRAALAEGGTREGGREGIEEQKSKEEK